MAKRIVLEDTDTISVPTSSDLFDLNDALDALRKALKEEAIRTNKQGVWAAVSCIGDAQYDIHGAAGWLAKDEGLIK